MATPDLNTNDPQTDRNPVAEGQPVLGSNSAAVAAHRFFERLRRGDATFLRLLLFGLVVWVFLPSLHGDFIDFDERVYVTGNDHVNSGLSLENIAWAFRNVEASNWHPLTWLSHMLDCQLYGLKPWGHHLTSVLLHGTNTVLLFLVLRGLTGMTWRSLAVAGLFGLHPLRVESVAWISERKDVLSTLFALLTLWAYGRYAPNVARDKWRVARGESMKSSSVVSPATRHPSLFYSLALLSFTLGLMTKPMLVTLPCLMLLLDYWPLGRFDLSAINFRAITIWRLLREKVPFFLLAATASVLTYIAQKSGGMMLQLAGLPLGVRIENALVSYSRYLGKLFWPVNLCALYPHPGYWSMKAVLPAGLLLLGASVVVWGMRRPRPYLVTGWLWYLGALVPAIGLVQVGNQSMADRYTYLPSIGVLIVLVWGVSDLTARWRYRAIGMSAMGVAVTLVCIGLTRHQIGYWKDGVTVWSHAVEITQNNYTAHSRLADALERQGRHDEALDHGLEATRLQPDLVDTHYILAAVLLKKGRPDESIAHLQKILDLRPLDGVAHNNLGLVLLQKGQADEAIAHFREALAIQPDRADSYYNLGQAYFVKGQVEQAIAYFQKALRVKPDWAKAHSDLAVAFLQIGRRDEAIVHFQKALEIQPGYAEVHNNLGVALLRNGRAGEAIREFKEALRLNPDFAEAHNNLGMAQARNGRLDEAVRQFQAALRLKPDDADASNYLALALRLKQTAAEPSTLSTKPGDTQPH